MSLTTSIAPNEADVLAAFETEALPHSADLYRAALRMLQNPTKAQDAVQETYLLAWKSFHRYERGTNCRAWLFGVLFNVVRHERRIWAKWLTGREEDVAESVLLAPEPVPDMLSDREILHALDALQPQYRSVVLLVDVEEFSYKEASEILQVPIGTVMSRLSRARGLLRQQLAGVAASYGLAAVK